MYALILASKSPRRKMLLEQAGFIFHSDSIHISEKLKKNISLRASVEDLARTKGHEYLKSHNSLKSQKKLVLSADTIVALDEQVLGKPKNFENAVEMLQQLSGKTHSVITGLCLHNTETGEFAMSSEETKVEFRELSEQEILDYVETGDPFDKAGAYGIQGQAKAFVKEYHGSWDNVVGLPIKAFESLLKERQWDVPRKKLSICE